MPLMKFVPLAGNEMHDQGLRLLGQKSCLRGRTPWRTAFSVRGHPQADGPVPVLPARSDVMRCGYWKPLAKMMSQVWFS